MQLAIVQEVCPALHKRCPLPGTVPKRPSLFKLFTQPWMPQPLCPPGPYSIQGWRSSGRFLPLPLLSHTVLSPTWTGARATSPYLTFVPGPQVQWLFKEGDANPMIWWHRPQTISHLANGSFEGSGHLPACFACALLDVSTSASIKPVQFRVVTHTPRDSPFPGPLGTSSILGVLDP